MSAGTDNTARMYDLLSGASTQVGHHDGPIKCVRWFEMAQGGILATGSWDKTLRVRERSLFPPSSILLSPFVPFLPSTWSLMLGNACAEYQSVLGSSIARPAGHCPTKGTMLCHGREEPGAGGRNSGPAYPDIRPLKPNYALQSRCFDPSPFPVCRFEFLAYCGASFVFLSGRRSLHR